MATLNFASSHNMVAFLDKPTELNGFEQIVDFLNAHPIKYALTVNPTIYTTCIEQLWATIKVKTVNREVQIQALVDKKKVIITETSIRSDLQLEDAEDVTLADETHRRNDEEIFDTCILDGEEVFAEQDVVEKEVSAADPVTTVGEVVTTGNVVVSTTEVTTDSTTTKTVDELTLAHTLIEIKAAKPKARGAKDKGKAKMVEPEKPLKKKDQIMFNKEVAQKFQAQLDAELEEEEKLARQREVDANIAE
ncbi:hypothetical protein Tco_0156845 [Tanacetum coccineum]